MRRNFCCKVCYPDVFLKQLSVVRPNNQQPIAKEPSIRIDQNSRVFTPPQKMFTLLEASSSIHSRKLTMDSKNDGLEEEFPINYGDCRCPC